ncbi:MAG TPA: class II aldolase/adducin family protein [Ktedonobacterales bacterium]|nr:class II aldolase/adducin family protein [Ktedonobacterales bacterium]
MSEADQIVEAIRLLFATDVMSRSGHANASMRMPGPEPRMLLTAQGNVRGITADQLALVTFDGEAVEGELAPVAREIVAMHAAVYRTRPDVSSVIHTHSPRVTAFALAHQPLPCVYEALLRFGVTGDIPVAAWAPRGSQESAANIVEQLTAHPHTPAVLLANHGLLAFGAHPLGVAQLIIAMEEAAEMTLDAQALGPGAQPFPTGALEREREHMRRFGSTS